jgi:hypothetical protein
MRVLDRYPINKFRLNHSKALGCSKDGEDRRAGQASFFCCSAGEGSGKNSNQVTQLEQCFSKVREISSGPWLTAAPHHSKQLNWLIEKLHAVREPCEQDTFARVTLKFFARQYSIAYCISLLKTSPTAEPCYSAQ